jgi:hypothetical protein
LILALTFASCEKEKIIEVEVEKQHSWQLSDHFLYDQKVLFNSHADSAGLYAMSKKSFSTLTKIKSDPTNYNVEHAYLWFEYPIDYKMPINSNVFAGTGESYVLFFPTKSPVGTSGVLRMQMQDIDPLFAMFDMSASFLGEGIAINDKQQCLIPYLQYEFDTEGNRYISAIPSFILAELSVLGESIDTVSCSRFSIDDSSAQGLRKLHSIDDYFIISMNRKCFRLSADLEVKEVLNGPLSGVIKNRFELYGIGGSKIYKSTDHGNSWQLLGENIDQLYQFFNFSVIENEIIMYRFSQLFHVEIGDTRIEAKEIDNDGLEGNSISSLSQFDGKVYVTTFSGMYTRSIEDFFTYKSENLE